MPPGAQVVYPAYGYARPDIASALCVNSPDPGCMTRFQHSGFSTAWTAPPGWTAGRHSIALYGRQTSNGNLVLLDVRFVYAPFPFVRFLPFVWH